MNTLDLVSAITFIPPVKTILSPNRYPYAVARIKNGRINDTIKYFSTLEECLQGAQKSRNYYNSPDYIAVEMREIGEAIPNKTVNTYWVPV
jgi:hypothetical protein